MSGRDLEARTRPYPIASDAVIDWIIDERSAAGPLVTRMWRWAVIAWPWADEIRVVVMSNSLNAWRSLR